MEGEGEGMREERTRLQSGAVATGKDLDAPCKREANGVHVLRRRHVVHDNRLRGLVTQRRGDQLGLLPALGDSHAPRRAERAVGDVSVPAEVPVRVDDDGAAAHGRLVAGELAEGRRLARVGPSQHDDAAAVPDRVRQCVCGPSDSPARDAGRHWRGGPGRGGRGVGGGTVQTRWQAGNLGCSCARSRCGVSERATRPVMREEARLSERATPRPTLTCSV